MASSRQLSVMAGSLSLAGKRRACGEEIYVTLPHGNITTFWGRRG